MDLGSGSATALPIVGHFWNAMHNDAGFKKMTEARFQFSPSVQSKMGCPLLIPFPPDTLQMLMADTIFRDSILANGYKNLENLARQKFGISVDPESIENGEAIGQGQTNGDSGDRNTPLPERKNEPLRAAEPAGTGKNEGTKSRENPKKGNGFQ
jgi:hypothetical protein